MEVEPVEHVVIGVPVAVEVGVPLIGCTFVENDALPGGGMSNEDSTGRVVNTRFIGNRALTVFSLAAAGGAANFDSNPTLSNCIVWDNGPSPMVDPDGADGETSTAADNDDRLAPGSPLIDAGNSLTVPDGARLDLDWNPRFVADPTTTDTGFGGPEVVDMGPYEYQPPVRVEVQGLPTTITPL